MYGLVPVGRGPASVRDVDRASGIYLDRATQKWHYFSACGFEGARAYSMGAAGSLITLRECAD